MVDQSDSTAGYTANHSHSFSSTDVSESAASLRDVNKPEQSCDEDEMHPPEADPQMRQLPMESGSSTPQEASFPTNVGSAASVLGFLQNDDYDDDDHDRDSYDIPQVSNDAFGTLDHHGDYDPGVGNSGWQPASALFSSLHQPPGGSFSSSGSSLAPDLSVSWQQLDANPPSQVSTASTPDVTSAQGQILYSIPNIANAAEQAAGTLNGDTVSAFTTSITQPSLNAVFENTPGTLTPDLHSPDAAGEDPSLVFGYQPDFTFANGIWEDVADAGNLLQSSRLSHFTHDRLPMTLSAEMSVQDDYDGGAQVHDGADSVYASDDDFSLGDPIEASHIQPSSELLSPLPVPSATGNAVVSAEDGENDENEDEHLLAESMTPHLLHQSVPFQSAHAQSSMLAQAFQIASSSISQVMHQAHDFLSENAANPYGFSSPASSITTNVAVPSQPGPVCPPVVDDDESYGDDQSDADVGGGFEDASVVAPSSPADTGESGPAPHVPSTAQTSSSSDEHQQSPVLPTTYIFSTPEIISPSFSYPYPPILHIYDYDALHSVTEYSKYHIDPVVVFGLFSHATATALLSHYLAPPSGDMVVSANGEVLPAFEPNLTVDQFIRQWLIRSRAAPRVSLSASLCPISEEAAHVMSWPRRDKISRPDEHGFKVYDIQDIPWSSKLKVSRSVARVVRDAMYRPYHNLKYTKHGCAHHLLDVEDYFLPKTMYTKYKATMSHFQLRNLMSVTASGVVQYARHSRIYSARPFYNDRNCVLDYSNIDHSREFTEIVKISTMKAKHGVTIIGGFNGEYAFKGEISDYKPVEGFITKDVNSITNHIDIFKHRTSGSPQAVIASNDLKLRTLDCELNKFVDTQTFARAINCTDTSPDGRLRVIVGDAPDAWITDSESGKPLEMLKGHQDFSFACAWSPDMLHIATSNQDKTVNIWDARMWRILSCIDSDVAGYRSLRFSPVGGGPRTLLMCEPADRISIVNAQTYQTRQVHDFFGEIGGADYTPDGGRIWVANMDYKFGGLMEFERCQWGAEFGMNHTRRRAIEDRGDVYYPDLPNEWVRGSELDEDPRCLLGPGERALRFQRLMSDSRHSLLDI